MGKLREAVWMGWRQRAKDWKKDARKTDADLAAEVSEQLEQEIGRGAVNHWLTGRNDPTITQFMALCTALGADPGQVLLNVRVAYQHLAPASAAAKALHSPATTPEYLSTASKKLKRSKAVRKPKVRVR